MMEKTILLADSALRLQLTPPEVETWRSGKKLPQTMGKIAGEEGRCETLCWDSGRLALHQEFLYCNEKMLFLRQTLFNTGSASCAIPELKPLLISNLDFGGVPETQWRILSQKRMKFESPTAKNFMDIADYIDIATGRKIASFTEYADSFMVLWNGKKALLLGFIETDRQLSEIRIRRSGEKLGSIEAVSDFTPAHLPPGGRNSTQWLAIVSAETIPDAVREYAGLVRRFYGLPPVPKDSPAVASSWHYYGITVSEKTVHEELKALRRRHVPADVYQLDGGWAHRIGDIEVNQEKFPSGLKALSGKIREAGFIPGIWTAGFLMAEDSALAKAHPEWVLRHADGCPVTLKISQLCLVMDTSLPEVQEWVEKFYRKLKSEYGFDYFKVDFTRVLFLDPDARPSDQSVTLLELFTKGFQAVRRGIGEGSHLNICGGHIPCGMSLSESFRTSSDTYGKWTPDTLRQSLRRSWFGYIQHPDPDAMNFRLCRKTWDETAMGRLPLGNLTPAECRTVAVTSFVTGSMVAMGDPMMELPEERLIQLSKVIPSVNAPSVQANPFHSADEAECFITPVGGKNGQWNILSAVNLEDHEVSLEFSLGGEYTAGFGRVEKFLIFDLADWKYVGCFGKDETVKCPPLAPHSSGVLKILPLPPEGIPFFVACDIHYSSGSREVAIETKEAGRIAFTLASRWHVPVRIAASIRKGNICMIREKSCVLEGSPQKIEFDFKDISS